MSLCTISSTSAKVRVWSARLKRTSKQPTPVFLEHARERFAVAGLCMFEQRESGSR